MPRVLLELFPAPIAAILITGAVAAMISTADSLLILSSTELSENLLKPVFKKFTSVGVRKDLLLSRVITAMLAVIALLLAYFIGDKAFIFTLVSYVWAGIGGTFSVVILLTLFWKRYHGKAVVLTIVYGILFTIIWINTGMEQIITSRIMTFATTLLVAVTGTLIISPTRKRI
jgi:sodium/proline symporter